MGVHWALEIANKLEDNNISIEVVDLRSLIPWDKDLVEKSTNALTENGFSKDKIIMALPNKAGDVGDYMAMLWMPPNPDHIKIQKISKVEPAEAEGMIGVWKGVSKDDLFEIKILK